LKSLRKSSAAGVILLLLILVSSMSIPIANAQGMAETIIFSDDFESYEIGTFPSSGGWTLVWDGAGSRYQVVTSYHYHSPSKSFQLLGAYGWSSVAEKRFSTTARMIGFEAYMMAESYPQNPVSTHASVGSVGFWNRDEATWGKYYVTVAFRADGYLVVHFINGAGAEEDIELQPYTPGIWYKVRVVLDRSANRFSVWVNDELKASNVKITETNINGLEVSSAWAGVTCYFDDVKVFTAEQMALSPSVSSQSGAGIKMKASLIENKTDGSYSFTLQIIPGDTSIVLLLNDTEIRELKNSIYNQLIQNGLLSPEDLSSVVSLVVVAHDNVIDENAVELFDAILQLPQTAIEVSDYVENFGTIKGFILFNARELVFKNFLPPNPPEIAVDILERYFFPNIGGVEDYILKEIPVYVVNLGGIRFNPPGHEIFIVGYGQELEIVVKGLKKPSQNPVELQISGSSVVICSPPLGLLQPNFRPTLNDEKGYPANLYTFSTSITLNKAGLSGWLGNLLSSLYDLLRQLGLLPVNYFPVNYYSDQISVPLTPSK